MRKPLKVRMHLCQPSPSNPSRLPSLDAKRRPRRPQQVERRIRHLLPLGLLPPRRREEWWLLPNETAQPWQLLLLLLLLLPCPWQTKLLPTLKEVTTGLMEKCRQAREFRRALINNPKILLRLLRFFRSFRNPETFPLRF